MGCGCGQQSSTAFKVVAADGSSKTYGSYAEAQQEIRANGGRIMSTSQPN